MGCRVHSSEKEKQVQNAKLVFFGMNDNSIIGYAKERPLGSH